MTLAISSPRSYTADPTKIKVLLQIRMGDSDMKQNTGDVEHFTKNILPHALPFFECALAMDEQIKRSPDYANQPIIWYLMADEKLVRKYATDTYGSHVVGKFCL
jgi:hypothetical protein